MKKTFIAASLMIAMAGTVQAAEWGYKGDKGPEHWGDVAKECATGKNQSPIDIKDVVDAELMPLNIEYQGMVTGLTNNGHTLQAVVEGNNAVTVDGVEFNLAQFHFHTPSENHIRGQNFPLEAHFVNADKDGNLAVVAVMYNAAPGENNQITQLTATMPEPGETVRLQTPVAVKDMLPATGEYYRFNGSLTTPPCSEGVRWFVLKSAQTLTTEQAKQMQMVMGNNNRPIQKQNARVVLTND